MLSLEPAGGLVAVPAGELLGHVRPGDQLTVRRIGAESTPFGPLEEVHISGQSVGGAEVFVSLRMLISDRSDPRVVFSLPGGAGAFPDATLIWLAKTFGGNHAAVDWIGRGRSPVHDTVQCRYDPIWLDGDSFRDAYLFHNIAAIWIAFDWLHASGFAPEAVVGGSWGGVYSLLLGALDRRVARIYSTFGCGGFSVPGIEKRDMWDLALQEMGPQRSREWFGAFDPLLRAGDIAAEVYFETATNDKFFSLDMAMTTWNALPRQLFLALAHNQDHTMRPYGTQPYLLESLRGTAGPAALAPATTMSAKRFSSLHHTGEEVCWPIDDEEFEVARMAVSHQLPARGNMSRAWRFVPPRVRSNQIAAFATGTSGDAAALTLFYLTRTFRVGPHTLHAATPVQRREGMPGQTHAAQGAPRALLPDTAGNVWDVPLGDKTSPVITNVPDAFRVTFRGTRRARCVRFGIEPWLLPAWSAVELAVAAGSCAPDGLTLFLSIRYNRSDETSVVHPFATSAREEREGEIMFRFLRDDFRPAVVIEQRFRPLPVGDPQAVLTGFDAIGVIDSEGRCAGDFLLRRLTLV